MLELADPPARAEVAELVDPPEAGRRAQLKNYNNAAVLELADRHGLEPCGATRRGSNPLCGTLNTY